MALSPFLQKRADIIIIIIIIIIYVWHGVEGLHAKLANHLDVVHMVKQKSADKVRVSTQIWTRTFSNRALDNTTSGY